MKKRAAALILALGMIANLSLGAVNAETAYQNRYGHSVTYKPVTQLYANGEAVRFFDAGVTEWGTLSDKITRDEAKSIEWLQQNNYLLNHFGRRMGGDLSGCLNSKGEWQTKMTGPRKVRRWDATVNFEALTNKEKRENGNISGMYDKGDIQYFFSWKVKTVQTRWGLTGKSNDTGHTFIFKEMTNSSGGGWKSYNTIGGGPNLGDFSAWKSGDKLGVLSFTAKSDRDANVDSYLSGAMLVGRDIKGPRISSVKVTADADGTEEIAGGAITLDTVKKLADRTVYFRVQWDEPVMLKNMSQSDIAKLALNIETIGIDGTSGMIAEAPFLKFEPSKTDGKPVMVFEYKIADPYSDTSAAAQERGYFYNFSKITVSEKENAKLWNNIYDISGNKFGADENGMQPEGKVTAIVGGGSKVDLQPFGIKSIKVNKSGNESNPFFNYWEQLTVEMSFNKQSSQSIYGDDAPVIMLNVKNSEGEYITAEPHSGSFSSAIYKVRINPGYNMDGTSVKVIKVTSGREFKDESGYSMMNYEDIGGVLAPSDIPSEAEKKISDYMISPDKQYKIDFDAPVITLSAHEDGDGVIAVKALIDDNSVEGCDAAFTVRVNGTAKDGGLLYQASASESFDNAEWISGENKTLNAAFGAPIVGKNGECAAYGFIRLPDNSEADRIDISVNVSDEAGNAASAKESFCKPGWAGFDKAAPEIKATVESEKIHIAITDMDDDITYMYGFSDNDTDEPAYTAAKGKEADISAPELPEDGNVHSKVVWIKARDSKANISEALKIPMKYDRTYTSIDYTADTQKDYVIGENGPSAEVNIKNTKCYWYVWAEKPAGVDDAAGYITEKYLDDFKSRAEKSANVQMPADDDPSTEQPNNESAFSVNLTGETGVAKINENDESYGDDVSANETTRPIMLVLAAERENGSTLVRTVEFNTIYAAPKANVVQKRFSTNDDKGKRTDYIRNDGKAGLIWASDADKYSQPVNTPHLFGFAQAEFVLNGDPVTGLERVNLGESFLTLERVVYGGSDISGEEKKRTVVGTWSFNDLKLGNLSGGGSAVIDIDISQITPEYYEIDEEGDIYSVRYEFDCKMSYTGGIRSTKAPIAYYAFNNMPRAYLCDTLYDDPDGYNWWYNGIGGEEEHREAVFDNSGKDITQNIPLYTINTEYPESAGRSEFIRFIASGYDYSVNAAYYGAPVQNLTDPENKAKLAVRIGTDPKKLSDVLEFAADSYAFYSSPYDISKYLFGDEKQLREVTLYYRFEHPDRGTSSPLYVMKLRRDNHAPVFDLTVSETEKMTNEVLIKINGVYDTQTAADGTVVVDTEEPFVLHDESGNIAAWRYAVKSDDTDSLPPEDVQSFWMDYNEETGESIYKTYVRVKPDEDGIYRFISNGYITLSAEDDAGNRSDSAIINGESVYLMGNGKDTPTYDIKNIDSEPPVFENNPAVTVNDGSFKLTAKGDETVRNVYVKFDKAYSELLSGSDDSAYSLKNVPGMVSGGFNAENGEITAEIYVKHSQTVPLSSVTLIIEDCAGNQNEYKYGFETPLFGKKAAVTNAVNAGGYPVWAYGETLNFSVPVKLDGAGAGYSLSYESVPIYADGITEIVFTDLFGESTSEKICADVYGTAFAHTLVFMSDGREITPQTKVSADVTVTVDTSRTKNLSVDGGKNEFVFSENGELSYSLINSELGETKRFSIPVTNIDKTVPEAIVSFHAESEQDIETGAQIIYSATYSIEGFSEDGVTLIPSEDGAAPSGITFDANSESMAYTFKFRDEAGNEGSYIADASEIAFAQRTDNNIADYRLTYMVPDDNGFRTIGRFGSNENIELELVNRAVSVKIEALNKSGDVVSSSVAQSGSLPDGAKLYAKEKLVMFTAESSADRTVNLTISGSGSGNSVSAAVMLPANIIDLTAPTGTVNYSADGNTVKAYLVTKDTDLADNGVSVTGTKTDGTAFELKSDENGYYTELDLNGTGRFILADKAGNVGTVAIAVLTIDKEPPQVVSEGWQSFIDAKTEEAIKELLSTPTNSTIKLFITFNEQLQGAAVKAYDENSKQLLPTDDYVTAAASGTALTVEFKQNCRAMLTVYDLRGNASVLWRPEDGPITVIDRDIPKLMKGYPKRITDGNTVKLEYAFEDGEEVMLLQKHENGYKNSHIVTVRENGMQTLNFADRAGNVFSDYPVISEIDDLAPDIKMSVDYVGSGTELSGNDSYKAGNFYTNKDVRILLNVTDATPDGITVTAKTKSGTPIAVKSEKNELDGKSYNYSITVSENGSYQITAADKWGHENSVETNVSVIDRTAPTVKLGGSVVLKAGTSRDAAIAEIEKGIEASDTQSGANTPIGNKLGKVNDGVKLTIDLGNVNLEKEGTYTAKISAADRLGNSAEKRCTVVVLNDVYQFNVNGTFVYANDVYTAAAGKIRILNAAETAKLYYTQGYKTAAQMKYEAGFDAAEGFNADKKGYYTILAQEEGRKMYLLYVYIN